MIRKYYNHSTGLLFESKDTRSRKTGLWKGGSSGDLRSMTLSAKALHWRGQSKDLTEELRMTPANATSSPIGVKMTHPSGSIKADVLNMVSVLIFNKVTWGPLKHLPRASENSVWEPCHRVSYSGKPKARFPREVCVKVLAWELWPVRSLCCCCCHCCCFKWVPETHFFLRTACICSPTLTPEQSIKFHGIPNTIQRLLKTNKIHVT